MNGCKSSPDDPPSSSGTLKHSKRTKSKDRSKSEPKMRTAISGYWSSDDTLDRDLCLYHHHHGGSSGGLPSGVMTMGRRPDKSQSQYFMESYNTISAHSLKTSRSNNDVKCSTCSGGNSGGMPLVGALDGQMQLKKSSWSSTLTVSRAREVYQKASVNLDKALVKAEQGRTCHFLQVGLLQQPHLLHVMFHATSSASCSSMHPHLYMPLCLFVCLCTQREDFITRVSNDRLSLVSSKRHIIVSSAPLFVSVCTEIFLREHVDVYGITYCMYCSVLSLHISSSREIMQ